jgi:hypothetical protein
MTVFQALMLAISFASLIIAVLSFHNYTVKLQTVEVLFILHCLLVEPIGLIRAVYLNLFFLSSSRTIKLVYCPLKRDKK